ncbi:unnamed protein product, partial [Brassica rapa subsp. trilocularis]
MVSDKAKVVSPITMHRDPRHCGFQKVSTFVWIVER